MKKKSMLMIPVLLIAVFFSCTKEGPRGPKGASGADGNANVKTFIFADSLQLQWIAANIFLFEDSVFDIPANISEEGMVLIYMQYYTLPGTWYFTPGVAVNSLHSTRVYFSETAIAINGRDPDGSTWSGGALEPVSKIRVVLVPPSEVTLMERGAAMPDFNDYEATMGYFGVSGSSFSCYDQRREKHLL